MGPNEFTVASTFGMVVRDTSRALKGVDTRPDPGQNGLKDQFTSIPFVIRGSNMLLTVGHEWMRMCVW